MVYNIEGEYMKKIAPIERGFFQLWKVGSEPKIIEASGQLEGNIALPTGEFLNTHTGAIYPPKFEVDGSLIKFGTARIDVKRTTGNVRISVYSFLNETNIPDIKIECSPDLQNVISIVQKNPQFNFSVDVITRDFQIEDISDILKLEEIRDIINHTF